LEYFLSSLGRLPPAATALAGTARVSIAFSGGADTECAWATTSSDGSGGGALRRRKLEDEEYSSAAGAEGEYGSGGGPQSC